MLIWEFKKLSINRWNGIIAISMLTLWGTIMFYTAPTQVFIKSTTFWHVLGSLTMGMIILFVNTKLFSEDLEEQIEEVVLTTKYGRGKLFCIRILSSLLYTVVLVMLLFAVQLLGFYIFQQAEHPVANPFPLTITTYFLKQILFVLLGSLLFTIFTACICTIVESHTVTVIICGVFFCLTYVLRGSLLQSYTIEWFLETGFFSYILRVKAVFQESNIEVLTIWYAILLGSVAILTKKIQKRRHKL